MCGQIQHSPVDIFNLKENGGNTGSEAQNQNKLLGGKSQQKRNQNESVEERPEE